MSASMAEGMGAMIRKAMLDHRVVWELDPDGETLAAHCDSCAYLGSELETFEHQANIAAEVLAANGFGKLEDAWDEGHQSGRNDEWCLDDNPYRRPE